MSSIRQALRIYYKELVSICIAFVLMITAGIWWMSHIREQQLNVNASVFLRSQEVLIMSSLRDFGVTLHNAALTIQKKLDDGEDIAQVRQYMTLLNQHLAWPSYELSGLTHLYGYIMGDFIDTQGGWLPSDEPVPGGSALLDSLRRTQGKGMMETVLEITAENKMLSFRWGLSGARGEDYGVIALDMNLAYFTSLLTPRQFAQSAYSTILLPDFTILAYEDEKYVGQQIHLLGKQQVEYANELRSSQALTIAHLSNLQGKQVVVYSQPMQNGWYQSITIPTWDYYESVYTICATFALLGAMLFGVLFTQFLRISLAKLDSDERNESKTAFLARINHEIRTPLNAVIGLSEVELSGDLPADTRKNLEKIHAAGAVLLGIINDVLDISKIEAGKFELSSDSYDLPTVIHDTAQVNMASIGSRKIFFRLMVDAKLPRVLRGDELRLKQILNNLLSNAFKYTDEGLVVLSVRGKPVAKGVLLTLIVSDTGRGIKRQDINRMFMPYSQLDPKANRRSMGTGLGLAITRSLVEAMGGTVSLKSRYGIGSIFTVNLLQGIVDENPIGPQLVKDLQNFRFVSTWHPRRRFRVHEYMPYGTVLVVDDIRTNLDVLRGLLLPYGLTVDYAGSGSEAVKKIRKNEPHYDLVLMDHMMPGMDGVETTRIIREEIGTDYARTVPIIALTANALAESKAMFMECGFNGFISKPIDLEVLDSALNAWIRDKQSEATLQEARELAKRKITTPQAKPSTELSMADSYLDGIDLQENARRYENEKIYIKILQSYSRYTPPLLEKIREIYNLKIAPLSSKEALILSHDILRDGGYLTEYASAVHGIKGSSYAIGADAVGRFAESMEFVAKSGNSELLSASHDIFVPLVESLLDNLQEFLSAYELNEMSRSKAILPEPDPRLLKKILEASKRYKLEDMENALVNLEKCSYESAEDLVSWLREQVDNLEYDLVREKLEQVLSSDET